VVNYAKTISPLKKTKPTKKRLLKEILEQNGFDKEFTEGTKEGFVFDVKNIINEEELAYGFEIMHKNYLIYEHDRSLDYTINLYRRGLSTDLQFLYVFLEGASYLESQIPALKRNLFGFDLG
jgi:hypothetical protein